MADIVYRDEAGRDLFPSEIDANNREFEARIEAAATATPDPPYPSNIVQSGLTLSFYLSDASLLGTVTIPQVAISHRGDWQPATNYFVNDLVRVRGVGFFLVSTNHTSAGSFPGANSTYLFQYADQQVQLPLVISTSTLTLTRTAHLNRILCFTNLSGCDVSVDPADWANGDPVHLSNRSGATVTISGSTDLVIDPEDGKAASLSTRGAGASMIYLEDEDAMWLFGGLDAVSA